ncbi:hypothetical protein MXB_3770, partial [Myxobolus squamalis]
MLMSIHLNCLIISLNIIRRQTLENFSINMDSTFKSFPRTFDQLYNIHVIKVVDLFLFSTALKKMKLVYKRIRLGI